MIKSQLLTFTVMCFTWKPVHFCMWATHKSLFLRLPWRTWVCSSGDRVWKWHNCLNLGNTLGARWAQWPWVQEILPYWEPFSCLQWQALNVQGGTVLPMAADGMWGERGYRGGSTPCMWLNSALLPWQSNFPPKAFYHAISSLLFPQAIFPQLVAVLILRLLSNA